MSNLPNLNDSQQKLVIGADLLDLSLIEAEILRRKRRKIDTLFPDAGELRRELYPKHIEFFAAGGKHAQRSLPGCGTDCDGEGHRERMFCAGNRVGKTTSGGVETSYHATGAYPDWWPGRRFDCPIDGWIAGQTKYATRNIPQFELLGKWGDFGTGLIPYDSIIDWTRKEGIPEAVDVLYVRHVSGGVSSLGFKAYAEGPGAFQGTAKHLIWFDEECSLKVYTEALLRTAIVPGSDAGGIVLLTFTPLLGWSDVVDAFLGGTKVI